MRTLKRTLALVLALVMALGMMTTMAGAAKLEDLGGSNKVADDYKAAMGVLVGMDIFQGDEKGELNPEATVTRAEMSRLLYAVVTGDVDSKSTPAITTQVFNDVPTTHWAAPYINWAQASGYVVGYGDGNFGPSDTVTGYQAMLMLLQALGYNKQGEIGGADYEMQTHTWAAKVGLTKNVSANYSQGAARQEIGQYIFDMLQTSRVFWSTDNGDYSQVNNVNTYTYGLANFNFAASSDNNKLEAAMIASLPNNKGKVDIITDITSSKASDAETAKYEYDAVRSEVGRVADIYVSTKGVVYYVDILSEDVVVAAGTNETNYKKAVTTPYNKTLGAGAYVFANYEPAASRTTIMTHKTAGGICTAEIQKQGATYVIYDEKVASVVYTNMTVEKVIVDKDGNVTLGKSGDDITRDYVNNGDTDLTKKGNYYMNCIYADGTYTLTDVETITAAASRYYDKGTAGVNSGDEVTINGTKYELQLNGDDIGDNTGLGCKYDGTTTSKYTWYISGATGNIIGTKTEDEVDENTYGFVVACSDSLGTYYSRIVLADGTNKTYETDKDYGNYIAATHADYMKGKVVTISLDSDGVAELTAASVSTTTITGTALTNAFNQYTASSTLGTAYVNDGDFVYMESATSASGVTHKEGIHSSTIAVNATVYLVKDSSSKAITVAFIVGSKYAQGTPDSSDYYFYDGSNWKSGTKYYVELYNLETGAKGEYCVGTAASGVPGTKGVYVATVSSGSNYALDGTDANIVNSVQIDSIKTVSGKSYYMINNSHSIAAGVVVMDQDDKFAIGDRDDLYTDDYISYAFNDKGEIIGVVLLKDSTSGGGSSTVTPTTITGLYYYNSSTTSWVSVPDGTALTGVTVSAAGTETLATGIWQVAITGTTATATQVVTGYTFTSSTPVTYAAVDGDNYRLNGSYALVIAKGTKVLDTTGNMITTGERLANTVGTLASGGNTTNVYCVTDASGNVVACVVI